MYVNCVLKLVRAAIQLTRAATTWCRHGAPDNRTHTTLMRAAGPPTIHRLAVCLLQLFEAGCAQ
jgi:hypothetical protein